LVLVRRYVLFDLSSIMFSLQLLVTVSFLSDFG
jgi:hypothetical protein